jgi:hypothetical protein
MTKGVNMRAGMFGTVPIIDTDMMRIIPDPTRTFGSN